MANLFKEAMKTIDIQLTSGARIKLAPSISNDNDMVFSFCSKDIDIAFQLPATANNYNVISIQINLGRYSQAIQHAAHVAETHKYKQLSRGVAKFGLIA